MKVCKNGLSKMPNMSSVFEINLDTNVNLFLEQFQEYYTRIYGDSDHVALRKKGRGSGIKITRLLRELSDDETEEEDNVPTPSAAVAPIDPRKPWLKDFNYYLNTFDHLAENQTIVQWWGVSLLSQFNTWQLLLIFVTAKCNTLRSRMDRCRPRFFGYYGLLCIE
jgi:hypothetical protein